MTLHFSKPNLGIEISSGSWVISKKPPFQAECGRCRYAVSVNGMVWPSVPVGPVQEYPEIVCCISVDPNKPGLTSEDAVFIPKDKHRGCASFEDMSVAPEAFCSDCGHNTGLSCNFFKPEISLGDVHCCGKCPCWVARPE